MLAFFAELLLRSGIVLAMAGVLCGLFAAAPANLRHRLWLLAFAVLLLWPVLPLVLPEVIIPIMPASSADGSVTVETRLLTRSPVPSRIALSFPVLLWMSGTALFLVRLAVGHLVAELTARRAKPLANSALLEEANALAIRSHLGRTPDLLVASGSAMPQALGLFSSRILLPQDFLNWSSIDRESVLLHEFAHLYRRDLLWHTVLGVASAIWWFQPLCWLAARHARLESERACDELVLDHGLQPSAYASSLLLVARQSRLRSAWSISLPVADLGTLEQRIESILQARTIRPSSRFAFGAGMLFLILACACSATTIGGKHFQGGVSMRRTIFTSLFPGLLPSASLSAAAIAGSVLDPGGAAVLDAKASLYNPDTRQHVETTSQPDGRFAFDHLSAGQYILRIDKSGFQPILKAFSVSQNTTVDQGLKLHADMPSTVPAASSAAAEDRSSAVTEPGKRVRVAGDVQQAKLVQKVNPIYPVAAKAAGIQGQVVLNAVIGADGTPTDIQVVTSPNESLSESALEAVRQWRYSTTLLNGNPVDVETQILVSYTLLP